MYRSNCERRTHNLEKAEDYFIRLVQSVRSLNGWVLCHVKMFLSGLYAAISKALTPRKERWEPESRDEMVIAQVQNKLTENHSCETDRCQHEKFCLRLGEYRSKGRAFPVTTARTAFKLTKGQLQLRSYCRNDRIHILKPEETPTASAQHGTFLHNPHSTSLPH